MTVTVTVIHDVPFIRGDACLDVKHIKEPVWLIIGLLTDSRSDSVKPKLKGEMFEWHEGYSHAPEVHAHLHRIP